MALQIPQVPNKPNPIANDLIMGWDSELNRTVNFTKQDLISSSPDTILNTDLLVNYKFNELTGQVLTDYSGNNHHAVLGLDDTIEALDAGWTTDYLAGLIFSVGTYITLPSTLQINTTSFTIEAVVQVNSYANFSRLLTLATGNDVNNDLVDFTLSENTGGKPYLALYNGNTQIGIIRSEIVIPIYKWVYLQAIVSDTSVTLKFNNSVVGKGNLSSPLSTASRNISYLGKSNYSSHSGLNGNIAMFRIYSKDLSVSECITNYVATRADLETKGIYL